ncbi:MAG TPA: hypothetical protein PLV55_13410 [Anaerohalosphaeraceae bacterium]|nr:hypothetical protein [Anaerohalosphaeraceae bacterium]
MTTHVFIVDSTTFQYHLEYLFAGTGARDYVIDFNNGPETSLQSVQEKTLVSMMADAVRIRKRDFILFYLQQNITRGILEGKFYGIFQAAKNHSFLDNNDEQQFLRDKLGKSLTFRTLIKPYEVYAEGVTEWEALDEIRRISSPNQMLWSLIYRKLKGNRGNTMITPYESERLCQLIRNKNRGISLNCDGRSLSFDSESQTIIVQNEHVEPYAGREEDINVYPRLYRKFTQRNAYEVHLQCYIVQQIGLGTNRDLDRLLLNGDTLEWIGNEVSCGVGMQRIDIMLSRIHGSERIILPIELKTEEVRPVHLDQLQRYLEWLRQYYLPNRPSVILPVLITKGGILADRVIIDFNRRNEEDCRPLLHLHFSVQENALTFMPAQ